MKIIIANLIVLLGGILLVISYYYLRGIFERFLKYREGVIARQKGWGRAFFKAQHSIDSTLGLWGIPILFSTVSYLLMGFGISASFKLIKTQKASLTYTIAVLIAALFFNYYLFIMEKMRGKVTAAQIIRMEAVNILIAGSLILGSVISNRDITATLVAAISFYLFVNIVFFTILKYFKRYKEVRDGGLNIE